MKRKIRHCHAAIICQRTALLCALLLSLCAGMRTASANTIVIVATVPALGQIAEAVGGEGVEVVTLNRVGQNPHLFSPRPEHVDLLARCDLLFSVGYQFEQGWLPGLIRLSRNMEIMPGMKGNFSGSDAIESLYPNSAYAPDPTIRSNEVNPHWWLDPRLAGLVAIALSARLESIDPFNASHYRKRSRAFAERIAAMMPQWRELMQINAGQVMTYQDTYLYFMDAMGIEPAGFVEPKDGIEPSTHHLTQLLRIIKQRNIKLIWIEPYNNRGIVRRLARLSGIRMMVIGDSDEGYGADGYIGMIDRMVNRISRWSQ